MRKLNRGVIFTMLGSGLGLGVALAGGEDGPLSRFRQVAPVVIGGSFISPQAELFGDLAVGRDSFVAGNTTLSAGPGTRLCLGSETNVQDNVLLLADGQAPFPARAGGCAARATTAKDRVSIAHQATVENSTLGNFTFVGFHSRVVNSVLEDGVFVLHGALVQNVRVPKDRLVPTGARVTTQAQADALPLKAQAQADFQRDVLEVNAEFAEGYAEQYAAQGFAGVTGVSAAPKTSWNRGPVRPTLGTGVRMEEFARLVGDVRLGEGAVVGRRTSLRADEGSPIVIGRGARIGDQVTFHALKGTNIRIGDNLAAEDNIVFHGPLEMGEGVTVGDDAVVFRSKVGNNVTIGTGALVIDVTLPDGTVVPEGARVLTQADADALGR